MAKYEIWHTGQIRNMVLLVISIFIASPPHSFVFEFVRLLWSEVCSARVTSLILLL